MKLDTQVIATLTPWFPDLDLGRVSVHHTGPVCWYVRSVAKQGAMTISPYVFFGREHLDAAEPRSLALLAHELVHVRQYREFGHVRFLFRYFRDLARAGFRYNHDLPLEAPAYALQREVREAFEQGHGLPTR